MKYGYFWYATAHNAGLIDSEGIASGCRDRARFSGRHSVGEA